MEGGGPLYLKREATKPRGKLPGSPELGFQFFPLSPVSEGLYYVGGVDSFWDEFKGRIRPLVGPTKILLHVFQALLCCFILEVREERIKGPECFGFEGTLGGADGSEWELRAQERHFIQSRIQILSVERQRRRNNF